MREYKSLVSRLALLLLTTNAQLTLGNEMIESKRHMVILHPTVDVVNATYIFGVENKSPKSIEHKLPILMPREKINFRPQEGVTAEDLILAEEGNADVWVRKSFKPALSIIGFGYQVPASFGEATLTFIAPEAMSEFQVMVPDDLMVLESADMEKLDDQGFAGRVFDSLRAVNVSAGSTIKIKITGVPEGRTRFLLAGWIFVLTLAILAAFLGWKTSPRVEGDNEGNLLI